MNTNWECDKLNYFTIAAKKRISGVNDWSVHLFNLSDGTTLDITNDVTVVEQAITILNPTSTNIVEIISPKKFKPANISGFYRGMKLKINNSDYIVVNNIIDNIVEICDDYNMSVADTLLEVGLTGDYKVNVLENTLSSNKKYQIYAFSKSHNLSATSNVITTILNVSNTSKLFM